MNIDKNAKKIIDLLNKNGYKAYAVGGCVRDYLMGRKSDDTDITTAARPEQTEAVLDFNNITYIETGMKHGTITALVDKTPYEITTFRTDGDYKDNRHPDNVTFIDSVEGDLSRRDFTINAIAYNDNDGYIDPFDGKNDIDYHIVRAVGNPVKRFEEDALRIMRAIRFSSVLSFDIDDDTALAALKCKDLLLDVSGERVYTELKKLLCGDNVYDVLIKYRDIIAVVIPELKPTFDFVQNNPWHLYDVYTHIVKSVANAPKDAEIRLAMLLHDIGKPYCHTVDSDGVDHFYGHPAKSYELSINVLKRLKVSNDSCKRILTLVKYHDGFIRSTRKSVLKNLNKFGKALTYDLIDVKQSDMKGQNLKKTLSEIEELDKTRCLVKSLIEQGEAYSIKDLAVNGCDLISMGYRKIEIGDTLKSLLERVINGELKNDKDVLLSSIENKLYQP